jgi:hypothetical protein
MGVPLGTSFDVAEASPVDSRMTWTGDAENLNQIAINGANRYPGLVTYVTGDQNLYVFQGNNIWEKIVTTNVDSVTTINTNFTFSRDLNGQVIYVNSSQNITATLPSIGLPLTALPLGYNVSIVQLGDGNVVFTNGGINGGFFRNRLNLNRTAGQYAVASILKLNTTEFLLYGDLV